MNFKQIIKKRISRYETINQSILLKISWSPLSVCGEKKKKKKLWNGKIVKSYFLKKWGVRFLGSIRWLFTPVPSRLSRGTGRWRRRCPVGVVNFHTSFHPSIHLALVWYEVLRFLFRSSNAFPRPWNEKRWRMKMMGKEKVKRKDKDERECINERINCLLYQLGELGLRPSYSTWGCSLLSLNK